MEENEVMEEVEEKKTYSVMLFDGTKISNLSVNGSYFITKDEITADLFEDNCRTVAINNGSKEDVYENMELVNILTPVQGEWWFAFRQLSSSELYMQQLRADIDYVAMMDDINI